MQENGEALKVLNLQKLFLLYKLSKCRFLQFNDTKWTFSDICLLLVDTKLTFIDTFLRLSRELVSFV